MEKVERTNLTLEAEKVPVDVTFLGKKSRSFRVYMGNPELYDPTDTCQPTVAH